VWYHRRMTKTLDFEAAIALARTLPQQKQQIAAEFIERLAANSGELYQLSPEEEAAIEEGLAEAERGEFISDEAVNTILRRPWR